MARPIEAAGNVIPFRRRNAPKPNWIAAYVRFWTEALDQLSAYLDKLQTEERPQMSDIKFDYPKDEPSMICTRSFDAPVSLVWKVFTTPEHVARWWGPRSYAPVKKVDKLELRKGGKWRFICERADGSQEIIFSGVYVDVVPESKLTNSFGVEGQFPDDPEHPEVHTFEERDGRTYYKSYTLMPNFEARDAVVATGMEAGGRESMEQLGELVDELMKELA
jgi:uncharacterized protein YndB with AHSA1/START domain